MSKWAYPKPVTMIDLAFGPKALHDYLPTWDEIPDEFKQSHNKWCRVVSDMFFNGIHHIQTWCKNGVNRGVALQHISSVLHSYAPQHEHKEAGCAYLLSLWMDDIKYELPKRVNE